MDAKDNLSAILMPGIDFVLKNSELKITDIDLFGVSVGPGLFTGIRVGLATLKGMLSFMSKPFVPVNSLKALAFKCCYKHTNIISIIDAKREEVYLAVYSLDGTEYREVSAPQLMKVEEIRNFLSGLDNVVFTGKGAKVYESLLKKNFPQCKIIDRSEFLACEIGLIALREYRKGNCLSDLAELVPLYIRKSDAENNYFNKEKEKIK